MNQPAGSIELDATERTPGCYLSEDATLAQWLARVAGRAVRRTAGGGRLSSFSPAELVGADLEHLAADLHEQAVLLRARLVAARK